jgi:N-acetylglucosaminyl-diphospho-decaprenol L-rhamnosyltransferase
VVIVSYRCRELLRACLDSLRAHPPRRPMRVIVVDNASGDGTVEMLAAHYPEVTLDAASENLGFAAATNRGLRFGAAPYALALNPDTRVTEGALERMLELMDSHPEVAISGCRLERQDGTPDHAAKRSFPTPLSALGHFSGLGRGRRAPRALTGYTAPEVESGPVDAVNGAFMLIRRRALEQVGGFDEGYWMYMEDLDLCYRLAEAGWTTWYEPRVTVTHLKAGTSGPRRSPRLNWAFHRGMYRFYHQHYAPSRPRALNAVVYAGIAVKLALALARSAAGRALESLGRAPRRG